MLTPSSGAKLGQGHAGLALDQEQRLMVDLVHGALGPQLHCIGVQLTAGEVKQLEPVIELFLPQKQWVGCSMVPTGAAPASVD